MAVIKGRSPWTCALTSDAVAGIHLQSPLPSAACARAQPAAKPLSPAVSPEPASRSSCLLTSAGTATVRDTAAAALAEPIFGHPAWPHTQTTRTGNTASAADDAAVLADPERAARIALPAAFRRARGTFRHVGFVARRQPARAGAAALTAV